MSRKQIIIGTFLVAFAFFLEFAIADDPLGPEAPKGLIIKKVILDKPVPDVFPMNTAPYPHKKSIMTFTHSKHIEEYKIDCGECHHDEQGQPLVDLKITDDVQKCFDCHEQPGERPKGKGAPKLSKKEKLAYHAEALHYNCKDCHKKFNKENKTKAAPTTCAKCHPKKPKA